jgi:CRISPR-associated protein (TIGR03984 family)
MNEAVDLHTKSISAVTLSEALAKYQKCFNIAVGLFYSPTECRFGKVRGRVVTDDQGEITDLAGVFEARVFNENAELRWLQESTGRGTAVLLFESNDIIKVDEQKDPIRAIHSIPHRYLLWGRGNNQPALNDWSYLSEARIGQLAVPIGLVRHHEYVTLEVKEYLQEYDNHGNVAVIEERLINLVITLATNN